MTHETLDLVLAGLRGQIDRITDDAKHRGKTMADAAVMAAERAVREVTQTQMRAIDKRIHLLTAAHHGELLLWGGIGGLVLALLFFVLGVWVGNHATLRYVMTFGFA